MWWLMVTKCFLKVANGWLSVSAVWLQSQVATKGYLKAKSSRTWLKAQVEQGLLNVAT